MINFSFTRVTTAKAAAEALTRDNTAQWIAGGTNDEERSHGAQKLIDINNLPLKEIRKEGNYLHIGALARNGEVADHELVRKEQPLLSQALQEAAYNTGSPIVND